MTPQEYIAAGFRVVPVGADKRPKLKGFGADNPTFCASPEDFGPDDSVGVLCGPCPAAPPGKWLICLDFDGAVPDHELPAGTLVTHEGRHAWHWADSDCGLKQWCDAYKTKAEGWAVDVRWAGGYAREAGSFDHTKITDIGPELERIKAAQRSTVDQAASEARTDVHEIKDDLAVWLIEELDEVWPDAGSGRHDCALALGGSLRRMGISRQQSWVIASAVMENNSDQPAARVQDVLDSWDAADQGRPAKGLASLCSLLKESRAVQDVVDRIEMSQPVVIERSKLPDREVDQNIFDVTAVSLAEPLPPPPWVCERLQIAAGRPCIFAGSGGSGKTWAAQDVALAVASGQSALGAACSPGAVRYLDLDQGRYPTSDRFQRLARGRSLDLAELDLRARFFSFQLGQRDQIDADYVEALRASLVGIRLCVIDSLRGLAPDFEENDSRFGGVVQTLSSITEETGCAFVVIAHTSAQGDKIRGSSAIRDRAGCIWLLNRTDDAVTWKCDKPSELSLTVPEPFETKLARDSFAEGVSIQASAPVARTVNGKAPSVTRERVRCSVLSFIEKGRVATITELKGGVRGDNKVIRDVAAELVEDGVLALRGKFYTLTADETTSASVENHSEPMGG